MIPAPLDTVLSEHLEQLLVEARSEDRTIEYKLALPGNAESERVPWLLKPVCSFANTEGGDLLFGVRAQDGIPKALIGVDIPNLDQLKLTFEHLLQAGIEPQVRAVGIKSVPLPNGRSVLIVRVSKSWISPHRLKVNARFYARSNAGAYELDVPQLKRAFLLSQTIADRIREFRADRIANAAGTGTPVVLKNGLRLLLHVLPLASFTAQLMLPVTQYADLYERLIPAGAGNIDYHLNLDGLVVASGTEANGFRAYTQLFRSGVLEFMRVYGPQGDQLYVPSGEYEQLLMRNLSNGLGVLRDLGFGPPVFLTLSLVNARGYRLGVGQHTRFYVSEPRPFERDVMVPDVELTSLVVDAASVLRTLFDYVWNAAGYRGSLNYDENGNWHVNP